MNMEVLHWEDPGFQQIPGLGRSAAEASSSEHHGLFDHQQVKPCQQTAGQQFAKWTRRLDLADRAVLRVAGESLLSRSFVGDVCAFLKK